MSKTNAAATHVQPELATVSTFWETFQPFDGPPLIEETNRDYLVTTRAVFAVTGIRLGETREHGSTWFVDLAYVDEGGTFRNDALPMSPNPVRNRVLNMMQAYLEAETDNGEPREPLYTVMEWTTTKSGQRALIFRGPTDEDSWPVTNDETPFTTALDNLENPSEEAPF